ncbi:MAG TPA: hypothetical protein VHP11_17185 [Tepidisphaeraceae bacterium]|nr:hypothetical protein [Tepidisphaeraceae bacterium]
MIRAFLYAVVMGGVVLSGLACAPEERLTVEQGRTDAMKAFQPIGYKRTGGIAGAEDRIEVGADGKIQVSGRLLGNTTGQLSEFQLMQLSRAFEGWEKLKDNYPAAKSSADAFVVEITFGQKTVHVSDAAAEVPESFKRARQKLEMITRDLPATR